MIKQKENNSYLKYLVILGLIIMSFGVIIYTSKQSHKHQYTLEELVINHKRIDNYCFRK